MTFSLHISSRGAVFTMRLLMQVPRKVLLMMRWQFKNLLFARLGRQCVTSRDVSVSVCDVDVIYMYVASIVLSVQIMFYCYFSVIFYALDLNFPIGCLARVAVDIIMMVVTSLLPLHVILLPSGLVFFVLRSCVVCSKWRDPTVWILHTNRDPS